MLQNVRDGLVDPQLIFRAHEAYFLRSGYVNSQSTSIWSDEKYPCLSPGFITSEELKVLFYFARIPSTL
jgi:hypothetical protein